MDTPAPPPPYSVQPQQIPVPISTLIENGHTQIISEKQNVNQYGQPLPEPVGMQQQFYTQPPQVYPPQQPMQHPTFQQPLQYTPNPMVSQQQVQPVPPSLPPEKVQLYQQLPPQPMSPQQLEYPQAFLQPPQATPQAQQPAYGPQSPPQNTPSSPQDAHKTGAVKRFFGDTLLGRVARSSVYTVTTTMKMPTSLSPWGDNNPVTLPNVRYRDAILFTTFAFVGAPLVEGLSDGVTSVFGADSFISEVVASGADGIVGSTVVKYGVFKIVEQAIDKGIMEHLLPEEERMLTTTGVKSLQVGIKHKLMGVDADLRFVGIYPSRDAQACDKGWFCPYLFASARTPSIPRANDFGVCQFFGPFLGGML